MSLLIRSVVCLFVFVLSPVAHALNCEPLDPRQQVGKKVDKSIEGAAKTLIKIVGGNVSYKSKAQEEVKNIYDSYPNADKIVIKGKLIYTFCTVLNDASDMTSGQKLAELNNFMTAILDEPDVSDDGQRKGGKNKMSVELDEFVFELRECKASASAIKCYFLVTNVGADRRLRLWGRNGPNRTSRIFLDTGDEVLASHSQLGASEDDGYAEIQLLTGVPVKASLHFKLSGNTSSKISAVDLRANDSSVQFRNVALK